jgi:hypothetical protein
MRIFAAVIASAFLAVTLVSSFSSSAYAARAGSMSGHDNTYGSTKGKKCTNGVCAPAAGKSTKKQ